MPGKQHNLVATSKLNKKWLMLTDSERLEAILAIRCEYCGALPDQKCKTDKGYATMEHSLRVVAAAKNFE